MLRAWLSLGYIYTRGGHTMKHHGMARRLLSFVMAVCICFSLVPWTVFAAENTTYTQVTDGNLTTGSYVLVTDTGYAPGTLDGSWITAEAVTATDGTVTGGPAWTLTVSDTGVTLTDANGVSIAPKGGNNNGIKSGDYQWSYSFADGKFTFTGKDADTVILASNVGSENKFRAYKQGTVSGNPNGYPSTFTLYKEAAGTTEPDPTEPTETEPVETEPAETEPQTPSVVTVADGTYVIWQADNAKALSALDSTKTYGYMSAVDVTLTEGTLTGYTNNEIFTITNTADGQFTITDALGRQVYMSGSYTSFNVGEAPTSGNLWTALDAGNGLVYIQNVEKEKSISYSTGYGNFGSYADLSDTSKLTLTAAQKIEETETPTDPTEPSEPETPETPAGMTAQLVTDVADLAAGDQIIIVASGSDFALSTEQKTNNRGQVEIVKNEDGPVVTYNETTQVITLEAGTKEGTFAFNVGNGYLYAASASKNYLKTEEVLSDNSSWTIEIADGIATVKAQGENTRNWLRHNANSSLFACYASGQADISIYKLVKEEEATGVADGQYVIWAPAYNMALSSNYGTSYYNPGVEVSEADGVLSGYGATEIWTVTNNEDGTITISCEGGKLSMGASYSSMPLNDVNDTWVLEDAGNGLWYVKNVGRECYIEWYASKTYWSGYKYINEGSEGMFALCFTPAEIEEEPPVDPADGVADGDYVIWAPEYAMALSTVYGSYYNNGVALTVDGDKISGYSNSEIWTVTNNEDGTITISCPDGKLAMDTGFSSMPLNAVHDTWILEDAGNGNWYVKNVGRSAYIEWYASKKYWSGYSYINEGSEGMFALRFTPVERSLDTDSSIVENIAQWGGMTVAENTQFIYGDKYVVGDEADTADIFTAVVNGAVVTPYTKGGSNDAPLYYMGAAGLGSGTNDYMQFAVDAAGWGDMELSFRLRSSNSGPGSFQVQYSTDGGATFQNFTTGTYAYAYTGWTSEGSFPVTGEGNITDGVAKPSLAAGNYVSFVFDVPSGADNCSQLLIRLVPGSDKANGKDGAIGATATTRIDSVVLKGSPVVDASITGYVTVEPNGEEDQPVGTALTMTTATENATIYYRVNGGAWTVYDPENKPTLDILPCNVEAYAAADGKADSVVLLYTYAAGSVAPVKFTPNGGGIYIEGESAEITLSTATEGAVIYFATSTDGVSFTEFAPYTEAIVVNKGFAKLVVQAYAEKEGYKTTQVIEKTFTERSSNTYGIYFGQLHSHTNISDGSGSVEEAFAHASNVKGLDFLAVTDHSNSFDGEGNGVLAQDGSQISDEWAAGHAAAEAVTDEDFVGIYGFEMTWSNGLGHMNTFNTPGWQSRTQTDYKTASTALQNYYAALATVPESISQFNHPGTTFGDFSDFAHYSEETDALITLIEVGNGEGAIGSSGYFPSYEYYTRALDKGWHVAPTNNQDNHKGLWGDANTGRSVILADSLTPEGIYDALRNYRVYATEDNDLNIYYTLNGYIMGSTLDVTDVEENLTISVTLSDATDAALGKIEVIVNGGYAVASQAAVAGEQTITVPADYNYYYIKVTQADGDIAVTAPVWVGQVEAVGISSLEAETALTVAGEEQTFTAQMFNNERKDLLVDSLVFTDKASGEVLFTDTALTAVPKEGTAASTFSYTFQKDGIYTITATLNGTLDGVEKTYTKDLEITVLPKDVVSTVIVDGTHYNDYVTGYYGGNMGNMTALAAAQNIQVIVETEAITPEMLENCSLLIVSAPAKKAGTGNTGAYVAKPFEDAFIEMVAEYVRGGGSLVVCGLADYQDKAATYGAEGHAAAQLNKLLAAVGSTMSINDDEVYDEVNNGGQAYRLYPESFNMDSLWCAGIQDGQVYSQYSGCTVNPGSGTWLVKGFDTTYSIDSDSDGLGGVEKGQAVFMAAEDTGFGGTVFVAGGVFMSDFEVKAELDNIWDLPYANRTIYENILGITREEPAVTPIAEVRASAAEALGSIFVIEGYVTAGTANPNTAFFDAIYVQDETGGITVFPYAESGLELGTKVRITGYTDAYQGDIEIQILSMSILDEPKNVIEPEKLSNKDAMDYAANGGELIQVEGEVVEVLLASDGVAVAQFVVQDENGDLAKVFIDGYILSGTTGENTLSDIVKVGNTVSAVGLLYMHPENEAARAGGNVAVLRVRDCDEVKLIKEAEVQPQVDKSALEAAIEDASARNPEDYTPETWAAVEEALTDAEAVLADENATQEQVDAATKALEDALAALEEKADKTELKKAIDKAKKVNKKDYTDKSYKAMEAALKVAEAVYADENATQKEVDDATAALNAAIKALVPTTGKNPETGDNAQLALAAFGMTVSLLAAALLVFGRRKYQA